MPDTTPTGGGEDVFRLVYRSHSLIDEGELSEQLGAIFSTARQNNRGQDITGALMVSGDHFVQALEGGESDVRELFTKIEGDKRHDQVAVVQETSAPRIFARWAMARVGEEGRPDIRLLSKANGGDIVAAPKDPSITPAQEEVLSFMRDSATGDTPAV